MSVHVLLSTFFFPSAGSRLLFAFVLPWGSDRLAGNGHETQAGQSEPNKKRKRKLGQTGQVTGHKKMVSRMGGQFGCATKVRS